MDPISHYVIRRPGCPAVSKASSEAKAHVIAERQNRGNVLGFEVYAVHRSGAVTGPYRKR